MNIKRRTITEVAIAIRTVMHDGARDQELVHAALLAFVESASLADWDELEKYRERSNA